MTENDLQTLVGDWLSIPELAEALGLTLSRARGLVGDREVLAVRVGENRALAVPAAFVVEGRVHPDLRGTLTVLGDSGMDDEEIVAWLFTPDDSLPVPGTPMDNLRAGRKKEIRRRAMELAF